METGLGTHTANQLLQDHCKISSRESGYHGKPRAPSRFGKTAKNAQIQATWLSSLQSGARNARRPGQREKRAWARRLQPLNFSRWSNTLCDIHKNGDLEIVLTIKTQPQRPTDVRCAPALLSNAACGVVRSDAEAHALSQSLWDKYYGELATVMSQLELSSVCRSCEI